MALLMANTSNVKEMKNGRPESVLLKAKDSATVLPNCAIVSVGDIVTEQGDHVREAKALAATNAVGKFVVVAPEINVQQYRTVDNDIAKFALEVGEVYTAYELQVRDRLEFSQDYFATVPSVGQTVNIADNGKLTAAAESNGGCLKVISVREQRMPMVVLPNGKMLTQSIKMVKVEVVK